VRTVTIEQLDPLVPYLSEDEQRAAAQAMADGTWAVEMDEERYEELWRRSLFHNAETILRTEDAMRRTVHAGKTRREPTEDIGQ